MHRHDDVAETLARRPRQYQPIFMHDEGRMIIEEWTLGCMGSDHALELPLKTRANISNPP